MQTQLQISYEGMKESDSVRAAIAAQVDKLEQIFDRITACRISVTAPSERHRNGGQYQVHIRLVLPEGREVNVDRSPTADERFADLPFAINDAFHRARRQLQDAVREMNDHSMARVAPEA
jgi:ribosome-associated translation inhibitor RaiA